MPSFKLSAYKILHKAKKPLHVREITKRAIAEGLLKTAGKTPEATMGALLITDVNANKAKSMFVKAGPASFAINPLYKETQAKAKKERKTLGEDFVRNTVIKYLSCDGWGHFEFSHLHAHGVDIKCKKINYGRYLQVEAKGNGENKSSDEVAFVYSLGQIITRMKDSRSTRNYYGIALPETSADIALRRLPWQVAKKLLLTVYSVNADGEVQEYSWQELKPIQSKLKE